MKIKMILKIKKIKLHFLYLNLKKCLFFSAKKAFKMKRLENQQNYKYNQKDIQNFKIKLVNHNSLKEMEMLKHMSDLDQIIKLNMS